MARLPILCMLLIIAVCANAFSHEDEDSDELLENIDSPQSFEDGALDADWNHNHNHKSNEKKSSKESKNRPTISDDAIVLPHEKFCKYFYVFDNSEARLLSCPKGQRFDDEKLQCLKKKEVNCGNRKKNVGSSEEKARISIKCPKWSGLHQHEYYCHLYYSCQNKKGRLFMCPQGMLFDNSHKRCSDRGNVDCNKRIDPDDNEQRPTSKPEVFVCPSSNSGKYPHERDCSAFYKCDNRRYKMQYCQKGKLYNERKRTCEPEHKVTCGSRIHPDQDPEEPEDKVIDPNPKFNCRENFGRYNHDKYCNWYYQCHDRRPSVRECRRGWGYHSHRRRCRVKHEVTCDGKPDHEDSTTEAITTTQISTESETTPTPTEPETTTPPPTPTEPETTTPSPTPIEPETTTPPTPSVSETTTPPPTPSEPEITTPPPTPSEPETTTPPPTPSEPDTTTPTPTEPETTTPTPTPTETTTTSTTKEPTSTKPPKVTAPDTDCDEDDVDCIIEDLGITPDWFICPEDIGSYPHPSSRKLFIFCLNWKPSVKKCGQDLLYSEDLRTCVHP